MALLYVALAFVGGLFLGDALAARGLLGCGWPGWLWPPALALLALTPLLNRLERRPAAGLPWPEAAGFQTPRTRPSPAVVAACGLGLLLGVARIAAQPLAPCWGGGDLAYYNEPSERAFADDAPRRTVEGHVRSYISAAGGSQRITVAANRLDGRAVRGALTLTVNDARELTYGLPVSLRGILATPPDFADFSYRSYLARHGIHSQMTLVRVEPQPGPLGGNPLLRTLYGVRTQGERLIQRALPEPYAALASGILLGIDASIPEMVQQQFSDTSATHVLVISGSNVSLIAGVLLALGAWIAGRRGGFVMALAGIAIYALLVGGEPSVLRAALMGGLVVLAARLGRAATALVSLGLATLILGLVNPHIVHDVGFQLSAAATAGLILIAPPMTRGAESLLGKRENAPLRRAASFLIESLSVTLAASLATLPLILFTFQRLSLIGQLTNLLIAPVQPLILLAGSGALVVGLMGLLLPAQALFWVAWLGLAWTLTVVERTASVRWASLAVGGFGLPALLLCYTLLGALTWMAQPRPVWEAQRSGRSPRRWLSSAAVTGTLAVAVALIWIGLRTLPDGRLHITLFPADKGMAALIQTPSGRQVLVDGGDDPARLLTELGSAMPFWDRSLDLMALTAPERRVAAAQRTLPQRLRIDHALRPTTEDEIFDGWQRSLMGAGVPVTSTAAGGWVELGDGAALWALSGEENEPLALKLVYGDFSALLPGDTQMPDAPPGWLDATLLVLPEGDGAEAAALLAAASPELTVAYGAGRAPGDGPVLYPATDGHIHLWTDGVQWGVDPPMP